MNTLCRSCCERIAKQIAEQLFQNGAGHKANRLVLEMPSGRDGGGWCKQAVVDVIVKHLAEGAWTPSKKNKSSSPLES